MADYQKKHGDFSMFPNKNKRTEKSADLNGKVMLDGKEYWISGWTKTSQNGERWISGSIGKEVQQAAGFGGGMGASAAKKPAPLDDDIPW
jgi:hypothetical protein